MAELDRLIALTESHAPEDRDLLDEVTIRNLTQRREHLRREMLELGDACMPAHELAVVLEGRPVHGHAVETEFLSKVLRDLQGLFRSIVGESETATPELAGRQRNRYSEEVVGRST